ncbi:hypothetical protein [Devosia sp. 1566]|uniref:COG3904 family protein n=1 Tax=Devosia sp. 1566 TaxID=2499144 RepID=UPI000FD745D5|nr:hypothetical protein [Devosia sp. 1566]
MAQDGATRYGPFTLPPNAPNTIQMRGDFTPTTAREFANALQARPGANLLDLASNGGDALDALAVAGEVFARKMDTRISAGAGCYSACAYVFLAGDNRQAAGELGVHQVSGPGDVDLTAAQYTIADILDAMAKFGVHSAVVTTMFRTPPEGMYVFSRQELAALSIERGEGDHTPLAAQENQTAAPEAPAYSSNVQVVAQTRTEPFPEFLDLVMPVATPAPLSQTLERIGFTEAGVRIAAPVLAAVLGADTIPSLSEIRVLFGPLNYGSKNFVPYRVSLYGGPERLHLGTIALTDVGDYKQGSDPMAAAGGNDGHLGKHRRSRH